MRTLFILALFSFALSSKSQNNSFNLSFDKLGKIIFIDINEKGGLTNCINHLESLIKSDSIKIDSINSIRIKTLRKRSTLEKELSESKRVKNYISDSSTATKQFYKVLENEALKTRTIKQLMQLFPSKKIEQINLAKCSNLTKKEPVFIRCIFIGIAIKN